MAPGVSRPLASPIQPSVAYASDTPDGLDAQYEGRTQGWTYSREGHPNATALAAHIDALEGVDPTTGGGAVVGSGMAAVTAVMMALLERGDRVVGGDQLYGRSLRMMAEDLPRLGFETALADPTDAAAFARAVQPWDAAGAGGGRVEPHAPDRRHGGDRADRARRGARSSSWTTPSPRRPPTGPWSMAPTWCCTP